MSQDYRVRPADEKHTLDSLRAAAQTDKDNSREVKYCFGDMRAVVDGDTVKLASARGVARFTHWAFGQLARMVGAPAAYLRELPAKIAADCINFGLHEAAPNVAATDAVLLVKRGSDSNGGPEPLLRSVVTKTYGRLFDADYLAIVQDLIGRHPGWEVEFASRSDHDTVVTISNKRAVIQDASLAGARYTEAADNYMYRSLTIGNSETGAGSVWYQGGMYRPRCRNLMLWSAVAEASYRRRHVGSHVMRDVARELARFASQYLEQSAERDEAIIRQLVTKEVASTKEGVIAQLRSFGATLEQANAAYAQTEMYEPASPLSYWGIAQGLTRQSQTSTYTDDRLELDRIAAAVLQRGTRALVAA